MELILIRHTTPNIEKGVCYGQSDIDVTDTFLEEIKPILNNISLNDKTVAYYTSPLKRCKILAELLSETIIVDDRLKELDFGDWEIDLHKRTTVFLEEIKLKKHTKVIIVTHAGVMRSLASYINNTALKDSFDLKLDYGAIIKFNL